MFPITIEKETSKIFFILSKITLVASRILHKSKFLCHLRRRQPCKRTVQLQPSTASIVATGSEG